MFSENRVEKHGSAYLQDFRTSKKLDGAMSWRQEGDTFWLHEENQRGGNKSELASRLPKERCLKNSSCESSVVQASEECWENFMTSTTKNAVLPWWGALEEDMCNM